MNRLVIQEVCSYQATNGPGSAHTEPRLKTGNKTNQDFEKAGSQTRHQIHRQVAFDAHASFVSRQQQERRKITEKMQQTKMHKDAGNRLIKKMVLKEAHRRIA